MEKYYLMAIDLGDSNAMHDYGYYHFNVTKNYPEMEKYYLMAINLGDSDTMTNYANYHCDVTKNYSEMEKYFLMAIDLDNVNAMNNYGYYHHYGTKNYLEMEKYYLMAIDLGDSDAMNNYGLYHQHVTKNYPEMEKYYLMAIDLGDSIAMNNLENFYKFDKLEFFKILCEHDNQNELITNKIRKLKNIHTEYINSQINIKGENKLHQYLYDNYIKQNLNSDGFPTNFKIITCNNEYNIHSFVLNSWFFIKLLDSNFKIQNQISLEYSNQSIEILIEYLYTNKFDYHNLNIEIITELLSISDQLMLDGLQKMCKWILVLKN